MCVRLSKDNISLNCMTVSTAPEVSVGRILFICLFPTDVKVQLCFPPWYLKTRILNTEMCLHCVKSGCRGLFGSSTWPCCQTSQDSSASVSSSPLRGAPSELMICRSLIKIPHPKSASGKSNIS